MFQHGIANPNHEYTLDNVPVTGALPDWLHGTLLRNGPGAFRPGMRHWFDGYAMLHKFSFAAGRVQYASKFLDTQVYRSAQQADRITYSEFASDPCRTLFQRAMVVFTHQPGDNAKVSITRFADQFIALAETPIQVQFDAETLESAGVFMYEDNPTGQMTTAHPHIDNGQLFNVVTRYGRVSHYHLHRAGADMQSQVIASINAGQPAYMHSFGMTQNYAIITAFPLVVNPLKLLFWLKPYIENFRWRPELGTPFWVVNRHTGEIVGRYEADPFFAFHHVNAYEQGDSLVLDMVAYPDADIITAYYLHRLEANASSIPGGQLRRYRLSLKEKGRVRSETLSDTALEMPHIDYRRYNMSANYRTVYGIGLHDDPDFYNQLVKIDTATGQTRIWREDGCYPGEPIFVPAPDSQRDDEGVVLSVVLDAKRGLSFLLVLDAATFTPLARATLPQPVLMGFHGYFHDE